MRLRATARKSMVVNVRDGSRVLDRAFENTFRLHTDSLLLASFSPVLFVSLSDDLRVRAEYHGRVSIDVEERRGSETAGCAERDEITTPQSQNTAASSQFWSLRIDDKWGDSLQHRLPLLFASLPTTWRIEKRVDFVVCGSDVCRIASLDLLELGA